NPTLYSLAGQVFVDMNDGRDNSVAFKQSDATTAFSPGYKSGPGWGGCTGLGRVNGALLLSALHRLGNPQGHVVLPENSDAGPALVSDETRPMVAGGVARGTAA